MGYVNTTIMLKYARPTVLIETRTWWICRHWILLSASRALAEGHSASIGKCSERIIRKIKTQV
jgi:hypothetical protein